MSSPILNYRTIRINTLLISIFLILTGCATTKDYSSISNLEPSYEIQKVAVMPVDVTLSILTAGGQLEPQAEWTSAAEHNIQTAINKLDTNRSSTFIKYKRPEENDVLYTTIIEHESLHRAVGQAILFNKYQFPLPTKKDVFDWTLGNGTRAIRDLTGADYALFIYLRDSYSSSGRVFVQIAAALLGASVQGGQQAGFASLVDLNNGNVVWFNFLQSTTGDLRTAEPALKTVELLLKDLPD